MAQIEPMDVDMNEDKENSLIQSNCQRTYIEKGVEELDASEFNMRLRYSTSPVGSPMSKSYSVCPEKLSENDNSNMTKSLNINTTVTISDISVPKTLPLQSLPCSDLSKPAAVLRQLDPSPNTDVTVNLISPTDNDENLSVPSSSSSTPCTPEATTPTAEPPKPHGSPIMRGLRSVLNMFRGSQSPIPAENDEPTNQETSEKVSDSIDPLATDIAPVLASTPLHSKKDKRSSPHRESLVFNEDLEKELQWDETTIIFSQEKIPIHKLFFQNPPSATKSLKVDVLPTDVSMHEVNATLEAMEVSYNDSIRDKTVTDTLPDSAQISNNVLSHEIEKEDSVFLDCETTFSQTNNTKTEEGIANETIFSMKSAEVGDIVENLSTQSVIHVREGLKEIEKDTEVSGKLSENTKTDGDFDTAQMKETTFCVPSNTTITIPNSNTIETNNYTLSALDILQEGNEVSKTIHEIPIVDDNTVSTNTEILDITKTNNENEAANSTVYIAIDIMNASYSQNDSMIECHKEDIFFDKLDKTNSVDNALKTIDITQAKDTTYCEVASELIEIPKQDIASVLSDENKSDYLLSTEKLLLDSKLTSDKLRDPRFEAVEADSTSSHLLNNSVSLHKTDAAPALESEAVSQLSPEKQIDFCQNNVTSSETVKVGFEPEFDLTGTVKVSLEQQIDDNNQNKETLSDVTKENVSLQICLTDKLVTSEENNADLVTVRYETAENKTAVFEVVNISQSDNVDSETILNEIEYHIKQTDIPISPSNHDGNEVNTANTATIHNAIEVIPEAKVESTTITSCKNLESGNIDKEITVSDSSSPFMKPDAEEMLESIFPVQEQCDTSQGRVSPPIVSKGYNFNFDEMEDPFATETNIRQSPSIEIPPDQSYVVSNQQKDKNKSFKGRSKNNKNAKSPALLNKNINKINNNKYHDVVSQDEIEIPATVTEPAASPSAPPLNEPTEDLVKTSRSFEDKERTVEASNEINKPENSDISSSLPKDAISSSSDQSVYLSTESSMVQLVEQKKIEAIAETDVDINPFVTKCKIRQSPTRDVENMDEASPPLPSQTRDTVKDSAEDLSNNTMCSESSKTSDEKDVTVREVNTEDEDTMEGPDIEASLDNEVDKFSDFLSEKIDLDNFIEPVIKNDDNTDADMFIDADAFDFLMNQNKTGEVTDSGKESLFLKFDPLFANRVNSDGILDALNKVQKKQSTPKKIIFRRTQTLDDFMAGPSNPNLLVVDHTFEDTDDFNLNVTQKPMMAVTPAVNSVSKARGITPARPSRNSMMFTSPAMAVIDHLLSLSIDNSLADNSIHMNHGQAEADRASLNELRDLVAEKELHVHHLKCETKELTDRLSVLQSQVKTLEEEGQRRLKNINELNEKLEEKTQINKKMQAVVAEYERTISGLIAAKEEDKKRHAEEREQLIKERDEESSHLSRLEVAFSDLHSKYEKSKQIIMASKSKEDKYRKFIEEHEDNLIKMHKNYDALKQHATTKLNFANQELEKIKKSHEAEVLKLNAMIKRKDMHITSLEETLAQKNKANEELTAICDELINKVG